jgi:hypothetical protein
LAAAGKGGQGGFIRCGIGCDICIGIRCGIGIGCNPIDSGISRNRRLILGGVLRGGCGVLFGVCCLRLGGGGVRL